MKSNSCFPFFFYTGEESLSLGHPCEVLEVDRHANLLEQKRPLLHEGLKICSLVNLFTLGVVGALHKTFYLDWAEVSLFTEQLHFVFLLLLAFCSRTHWHEFHVPLYAAICVLNSCPLLSWNFLCVSYSSDPCLCFIILGTEDRFTFSIRPCNCLTNEWYPDHTISPYMTVDTWQPIFFFGNFCGGCLLGEAQAFIISVTTVWIISLLNLGLGLFLLSKHCIKASGSFSNGTWNLLG